MGVHFDPSITLGTVIQLTLTAGLALGAWFAFKTKVDLMMTEHAKLIEGLDARLSRHEAKDDRLFDEVKNNITNLVGGVQRLVGQNEAFRVSAERRKS